MSDARIGNGSGGIVQDGLALRGETGPELMMLPQGSSVYPFNSIGPKQHVFIEPDGEQIIGANTMLKAWITDDLKRDARSVVKLDVDTPIIEIESDYPWKRFKPGSSMTFTVTFADGEQMSKTIERNEQ